MQATRLLQYNNPPQNQSPLQVLKTLKIFSSHVNQQYPITIQKNEKHSQY